MGDQKGVRRPAAARQRPIGNAVRVTAGIVAVALLSSVWVLSSTSASASVDATAAHHAARCSAQPWMNAHAAPQQRALRLVSAMTLEQKIEQLHGAPSAQDYRLVPGIPALCIPNLTVAGGPAGVAASTKVDGGPSATALPAPIDLAATWDPSMATLYGDTIGKEMRDLGQDVLEGPDVDIARTPLNGRTFEAFGEDPLIASTMAVAEIEAVQSHGVLAMVKHFAANNQETNRTTVNAVVDERTLHEIYFPPFRAAVQRGHVASVMCSYNQLNGTHSCENAQLLTGVLRQDWGFEGYVQSDFAATHGTLGSVAAGLDLEMPTGIYYGNSLLADVRTGLVPVRQLDTMLERRYAEMFKFGLFGRSEKTTPIPAATDAKTSLRIAEAGTVLLSNPRHILPLNPKTIGSIAVIGPWSAMASTGGGGSSHVTPLETVSPLQGIMRSVGSRVKVYSYDGPDAATAGEVAKKAHVVILVVGDVESEGTDRPNLSLPAGQDYLIDVVKDANPDTIVVVHTGAPVLMPWLDHVAAVVMGWYPGEEDGLATAAVLFGAVDPGGRLPITFPASMASMPTSTAAQYPGVNDVATYSEGLDVGYRWYEAEGIAPLFPFGFGLSYTTFAMDRLSVRTTAEVGQTVRVALRITNTGRRFGSTVAQVYLRYPAAVGEPPEQLRGFQKVFLAPGQSRTVTISLGRQAFSYWSTAHNAWETAPGTYEISVGSSSADTPLRATVTLLR